MAWINTECDGYINSDCVGRFVILPLEDEKEMSYVVVAYLDMTVVPVRKFTTKPEAVGYLERLVEDLSY
jgi:hypothetical protein